MDSDSELATIFLLKQGIILMPAFINFRMIQTIHLVLEIQHSDYLWDIYFKIIFILEMAFFKEVEGSYLEVEVVKSVRMIVVKLL